MHFPLQEPVLIFGFAVFIFLLSPIIMRKLRVPAIIGPIIAGVIVGPNGLELLARDSTIELLGTVGLLFIMFIAGLSWILMVSKSTEIAVSYLASFRLPFHLFLESQ